MSPAQPIDPAAAHGFDELTGPPLPIETELALGLLE